MSSPPVDPWSRQPEHGSYPRHGDPSEPSPPPGGRPPGHHAGARPAQAGGWPPAQPAPDRNWPDPPQPPTSDRRWQGTPPPATPAGREPDVRSTRSGWQPDTRPDPAGDWPSRVPTQPAARPDPAERWPAAAQPGTAPGRAGGWPGAERGSPPAPPSRADGWPPAPQPATRPAAGRADDQPTQVYGSFPAISEGDVHRAPGGTAYGHPTAPASSPTYSQPGSYPTSSPAYGRPGDGEPGGYPPGQAGGVPTGEPHGESTAKRSRLSMLLSVGLAGLLVLCLGGGGLAYYALAGGGDPKPVTSAGPGGGTAPSADAQAAPGSEPSTAPRVRLVTPKTLAGRAQSTDPELRALADEMVDEMKATVRSGNSAIGAFYGSPEKKNMVMVAGASGFVLDPARELNDAVKALSGELSVRKMSTVNPGPLGGQAKCGDGNASDIALGVCVWADQGSVGMIVMFFSSGAKAKAEFAAIRGQVEKRS